MLNKSQKMKFVEQAKKELGKYGVVGIANLNGIPDRLLQASRNGMKGKVKLILGRRNLLQKILEGSETAKGMADRMSGTSAIILSNEDPFEVYRQFKSNEIRLAAKPRQVAPEDIEIKGGETSLQPGQAVTELKQAGVDVQIQKGKVVIAKDKIIVRKGEVISTAVARVLHSLGTMPFRAVIEPEALVSEGVLFTRQVLAIDQQKTTADLIAAFSNAYALSIDRGIVNSHTVGALITKAFSQAMALGIGVKAYEPGIVEALLGSAASQAGALEGLAQDQKSS